MFSSWFIFLASLTLSRASNELLLMSTTAHIRYLSTSDPDGILKLIPLENISNAVAVAFDPTENYIYWSDVVRHIISRADIMGNGQQVLITDVYTVDGLTIDVFNRKLYWTDTGNDTIESSDLDGSYRKILINDNLDEPRAIVLDVNDRRMYWTDWGSQPKIERSRLNGSERDQLVTTDIIYPNGLALDLDRGLMYWADAILDKIEVAHMDGTSRKTLLSEDGIHPFAIVIIGNYIYWSDWAKLAVRKMDRFDSSKPTEIVVSSMMRCIGLKAATLKSGKNILLISGDYQIREMNLDIENDLGKPISSLTHVRLPLSLDFDVYEDRIYWTELETKTIRKAYRNGTDEQVVAAGNIEYPSGLALSRHTNELFWVDKTLALIEKINLLTHTRTTVINDSLISPTDIALDHRHRHIFWTDISKQTIERATYEGDARDTVLDNLTSPAALFLDLDGGFIYWADFLSKRLYRANLDGSEQVQLVSGLRVTKLAMLDEFLYWTDFSMNYTGRINIHTSQDFSVLIARGERFMGLGVIKVNEISFKDITPLIGPVAGGTNITITGENFIRVTEVWIGEALKCIIHKMNTSTIIAASPAYNITGDMKDFLISVKFANGSDMPTGYRFTYKPDPVITSLYPLTTLKEGGTALTVTGNNLDSVTEPILKLTRVQQTVEINTSKIIKETISTRYGECNTVNRSQLVCITPKFDNTTSTVIVTDNRKRRSLQEIHHQVKTTLMQVSGANLIGGESHHVVKRSGPTKEIDIIYAGLKLDGVKKYANLSKNEETRNFSRIRFIKPPTFNDLVTNREFVFSHGQKIGINGDDIDKLAVDNYRVDIGLDQCDGISLTKTKLFCLPPQKEPPLEEGNVPHKHRIVVHVGQNIAENIGDLVYPFNSNIYLGLGCGGVLLLTVIAVVIVFVCRRRAGKRRRQNQHTTEDYSNSQPNLINLPPVITDDTPREMAYTGNQMGKDATKQTDVKRY